MCPLTVATTSRGGGENIALKVVTIHELMNWLMTRIKVCTIDFASHVEPTRILLSAKPAVDVIIPSVCFRLSILASCQMSGFVQSVLVEIGTCPLALSKHQLLRSPARLWNPNLLRL